MFPGFLEALRVLTVLPIKARGALSVGERSFFLIAFPIVGAIFGCISVGVARVTYPDLIFMGAWIIPVLGIILSGATHFTGLCRTVNAFLAPGSSEQRLKILSTENAAMAGTAVAISIGLGKTFALIQAAVLSPRALALVLCFTPIFSRYLAVLLVLGSSTVEGERKQALMEQRGFVVFTTTLIVIFTAILSHSVGLSLVMLISALILSVILQSVSVHRLGIVPPAVLGALIELSEIIMIWSAVVVAEIRPAVLLF